MLDSSQLSCFQTCPERYRLTYLQRLGRTEPDANQTPAQFGKALHAGLAAWMTKGLCQEAIEAAFLSLAPQVSDHERTYTPQNGLIILQEYAKKYAADRHTYEVKAIEQPVSGLLNLQTPFLVKHDAILQNEAGIWVKESKTTKSEYAFTDTWWNQWEPNSQLSAQWWACEQAYGRCDGIILDGIAFSYGPRKGFVVNCERQIISRTPEQIADWQQNTLKVIERMQHLQPDHQAEKHESQCRWCQFRPLCLSVGSQGVREAMYQTVLNPYQYQEAG